MGLGEWLRGLWSGAKRYVEAKAWMADHDPVEEQRRWIAALEERIRQVEAALPTPPGAPEPSTQRRTKT